MLLSIQWRAPGRRVKMTNCASGLGASWASPGSDNPLLAEKLCVEFAWWAGPVQLPLDQVQRLAGPPGDPVLCPVDDEYWDDRVGAMEELAEEGWDPPPVIVASRRGEFVLEDGNHRVESVRQAGRRTVWAVVGFTQREDRDRFESEWKTPLSDR